jgi:TolB-like protein
MLAVLPFENLTGDPNKEYLADGLTEEMISQLGPAEPGTFGCDRTNTQRDSFLIGTKVDPVLKSLQHDPRYAAMLKKLNFPA